MFRKLAIYDISTTALNYFTSYLLERTQQVQIMCYLSKPLSAVPQGSILGTLLLF